MGAYNIAKLWKLPVVFVCENNKYGMGTSVQRSSASTLYYTRGDYIPGLLVDGQDLLAVREATDYARENGPLVLEMETYRYSGHSMSDPDTTYRTRDDIKKMRTDFDPITMMKHRMIEAGFATEEEIKAIDKEIRDSVNAEADAALEAPPSSLSDLTADIYAEPVTNVRGCDPFTFH